VPLLPTNPPIHTRDERGNGELQSQLVYVYSAGLNDGQHNFEYRLSVRENEDRLADKIFNKIINSITNKNNYIITTKLIAKVLSGQTEGLTRG